jgi:xanthine dehydrogenase accessory factor
MREIAEAVQRSGGSAVVARVVGLRGFSTLPIDQLVVVDSEGRQEGDLLGRPGAARLAQEASEMLGPGGPGEPRTLTISIHGKEVEEIGLSCGGQAEVLMQPVGPIPAELWERLSDRAPVALITPLAPAGGAATTVVDPQGNSWGSPSSFVTDAVSLLAGGRSDRQRLSNESGEVLIEAWVPEPRLVVVGAGDMVTALSGQADLLDWEMQSCDDPALVGSLLDWAGATAALIVLSHDPHVDVPALAEALSRDVAYVGAMGSRSTQSRRLERLEASGVPASDLARIHRPIGLNLGGRRAPEVALAIVAEILACRYGRDARSLRETTGPIHAAS